MERVEEDVACKMLKKEEEEESPCKSVSLSMSSCFCLNSTVKLVTRNCCHAFPQLALSMVMYLGKQVSFQGDDDPSTEKKKGSL